MIKSFTMTAVPVPPGPGAGTLIGKVREWGTGVALEGVVVSLLDATGGSTYTDMLNNTFTYAPDGTFTLLVEGLYTFRIDGYTGAVSLKDPAGITVALSTTSTTKVVLPSGDTLKVYASLSVALTIAARIAGSPDVVLLGPSASHYTDEFSTVFSYAADGSASIVFQDTTKVERVLSPSKVTRLTNNLGVIVNAAPPDAAHAVLADGGVIDIASDGSTTVTRTSGDVVDTAMILGPITTQSGTSTTTGTDGGYALLANPGTYTFAAVKEGYPSKYVAVVIPYLGTSSCSVFLKPATALSTYVQGTVTDSYTGLPIKGAAVVLIDPSITPPSYTPPGGTPPVTIVSGPTLTNVAGYYRLDI